MDDATVTLHWASVRKLASVASALDSNEQLVIETGVPLRVNREKSILSELSELREALDPGGFNPLSPRVGGRPGAVCRWLTRSSNSSKRGDLNSDMSEFGATGLEQLWAIAV